MNTAHRPGEVVGDRYRLLRVIGEGAMGVVWEAEHVELRRAVAIKILSDEACTPAAMARFEREARAASRIEHPNVVRVIDFGRLPSGVPFLAMEHLAGETLEEVLERRGPLSLGEACEWLRPIASALDAAHAAGIVHRDVKPANILCAAAPQGPRVTLIDFGLALRPGWDRLTGPGAILGTPAYLAPEAAGGKTTDARADVYSLGCVLFRMLTNEVPHERKTIVATLAAKLTEPAARLSDVTGERFPDALEALLARALSIDPELRPQTAGQLVRELVRVAEHRTSAVPPPRVTARPAMTRARSRRGRLSVALVAAALALVAFFAWAAGARSARAGGEPLARITAR